MNIELRPDYYLLNFKTLVEFVTRQYADLITDSEWDFIRRFQSLSGDAAKLFVRLCLRRKVCYFSDQLVYQEIFSIEKAIAELKENNFILINPTMEGLELLNALTKEELKELFVERNIKFSLKKELILENILALYTINEIHDIVYKKKTLVFKNKEGEVEALLHFFFGNRYQDLTEFILQDLGMVTYEKYLIDKNSRLFSNRTDFDHSLLLSQLSEESYLAVEAEDLAAVMGIPPQIPVISDNRKLKSQKGKILNRCAAFLEKNKLLDEALALYQQTDRIPSRERQARIFNTLSRQEEAINTCELILKDYFSEDEKEFAENFLNKLKTKKNKIKNEAPITKEILKLEFVEEKSVEEMAQNYLEKGSQRVFYVENALMNSLFGLWFWEVIFQPVQGAFCHPFQLGPLDLFTEDFYQTRKDNIHKRLIALNGNDKEIKRQFLSTYLAKERIANYFVFWDVLTNELMEFALECIPMKHLSLIFERMLWGLKDNCSGFPDLIAFSIESKSYEMIEIKGPGDKLQKNQTRWFQYFKQHEIPCKLIHIEYKQ